MSGIDRKLESNGEVGDPVSSEVSVDQGEVVTVPGGTAAGAGVSPLNPTPVVTASTSGALGEILSVLTNVNAIRNEIIRLGLNPALSIAIGLEVEPVLGILNILSLSAYNYSTAAFNLNQISLSKPHEVKKILDLIYDISDLSEDVLEVLTKLVLITLPKAPL